MKIGFNPHVATQAQSARGPQAQTTPAAPEGSDGGVTITLSQAAQQILKGGADYTGNSPAHQARQFIANSVATASTEGGEAPNFSGPFGQIVKTFAPGHNKAPEVVEEPAVVPEDTGEPALVDETGTTDGGDTTVADGSDGTTETGTTDGGDAPVVVAPEEGDGTVIGETDPVVVVEEPDIAEVLDESAPDGGETTQPTPESGMAGSGDAVASIGEGDVTDELLELLDENGEEVV